MTGQDDNRISIPYTGDYSGKQYEHELFSAIEAFILLSVLIWIARKMVKHPLPALVFLAAGTAAVWSAFIITHDDWYFYPLAAIALAAMGRMTR
jgi:hypothetical protein